MFEAVSNRDLKGKYSKLAHQNTLRLRVSKSWFYH